MLRIFQELLNAVIRRVQNFNNWTVFSILVVITLASSVGSAYVNLDGADSMWWSGWLQNFSTEMMGAIATFALFELIVGTRNDKKNLLIQMRSSDNATALNAVAQLRANAWLRDGSLQGANLRHANLQDANLVGANLQKANLGRANLQSAYFGKANLQDATLMEANLQSTNLGRTNLQSTNLMFANLEKADLKQANLQDATLKQANLQSADLISANLQSANLHRANLQSTDLMSANLQSTNLYKANLRGAKFNEGTRFNDKMVLPDAKYLGGYDKDGNHIFDKYWTLETDMRRYTDKEHPEFWQAPESE